MAKKNFESLDRYTREEFENQIRNNQNGNMAKGGKIREFDDVLIISKNKLGMVEAIADNIYYITTPFGESFEAALDDLKKVVSFAPGGSLQGHGFEVGDRIAEDLGGYIRVVSEDGKDYFIKLRDGDRLTEPPLPFKHGGKVKHSDVTRLATKTNETGDEVVDLTEFYEDGGKIYMSAQKIADIVIDDLKERIINDDEVESAYYEVKEFFNSTGRSYENNQEFNKAVGIVNNWMKTKKVGGEFYEGGGNVPKLFDVPAQFLDAEGKRKNDRKTIKELTDFVLALPQTKEIYYNDELEDYTPSRKKLHAEIINKFKKEVVCINNDKPIAIFMGGSPASGKSSFLRKYSPFLLKEEILKVDADEIRAMLPEYEGWNAAQTHLETRDIVNILLSNKNIGIPCDFDIIYDGTMNSVKSYIPLMDILRKRGYKIFIVYMDNVPKDVIIKRALERYKTSGRFVPLEVIEDFFSKGKTAFNELKKDVDGYMLIDGSSRDYNVIEEGGIKLPRDREYSKLGTKIQASDIPVTYKKGGLSLLY
jgi:predicted ABC-type ATPase